MTEREMASHEVKTPSPVFYILIP